MIGKEEVARVLGAFPAGHILITGAEGMLGRAFLTVIRRYGLEGSSRKILTFPRRIFDVRDPKVPMEIDSTPPTLILHCAGLVDVEACEADPEEAHRSHVEAAENIANLANNYGAKVFFPQSFLVFDGTVNPITEETLPHPLTVYGKVKLQAEELLVKQLPETLVVRMAGFFGGEERDKNFVGKIARHFLRMTRDGLSELEVGDRIWQPTFTEDLALNTLVLLALGKSSVYNMASHGAASFYDVAKIVSTSLGLDEKIKLKLVRESDLRIAETRPRPKVAILNNARLEKEGVDLQRDWVTSLNEYLRAPFFFELSQSHQL